MEVFAFLGAAETVKTIVGQVSQLINEILRAREDVRTLPANIDKLLEVVERLQPSIAKIRTQEARIRDIEVLGSLQRLGGELVAALEFVDEYEMKQLKEKKRPEALKVVKAFFNQGAARQQKEIVAICDAVEREHEELDRALTAGTYVIAVDTYSTVESTHSIVEGTQVRMEDTALMACRIESSVETLHTKVDQLGSALPAVITEPSMIFELDSWAVECLDSESYRVDLLIAEKLSDNFVAPGLEHRNWSSNVESDSQSEFRRGVREGGFEVENSTKIRFLISVQEDCFLYVLGFERGLPMATNLELIFPKFQKCKNKLVRGLERKFPNPGKYKSDPQMLVVERSALLKDGATGQVCLYVVLCGQSLAPDGRKFNEADIIKELASSVNSEDAFEDLYVKRFVFDVR